MAMVFIKEEKVLDFEEKESVKVTSLEMKAKHYDGKYVVSVGKISKTGYITEFIPFATGNFNLVVGHGRKSQKKLDNIENVIEENKQKLYELWNNEEYTIMQAKIFALTSGFFK